MAQASPGPLPLHPMTLGDILDGAFRLFKANWRAVLIVAGAFIVPLQLGLAFAQRDLIGVGLLNVVSDPTAPEVEAALRGDAGQELVVASFTGLLTLLVLPFVAGAVAKVVGASFLGEQLEAGPALRAAGHRWWSLVASWLLVHLLYALPFVLAVTLLAVGAVTEASVALTLGLALLLATALIALALMALFVAVAPAVVVEDIGPLAAMRRSFRLVRPRLFPVLGVALLSGLLAEVLGAILSAPFSIPGFLVGSDYAWAMVALGEILAQVVTVPFVAIVATLVYFDARIRHEALDLQVMAADLARGDAAR